LPSMALRLSQSQSLKPSKLSMAKMTSLFEIHDQSASDRAGTPAVDAMVTA
jgi:hypothetical protein